MSKEDKLIIDRKVSRNRETVCIVVKNLASNAKDKTNKVIVGILFGGAIYFSNVQSSDAIGMPVLPAPVQVERVQSNYQYDSKVQIAKVIPRKKDRIVYKSPKEILVLMYLTDPRISSNQEILKLVTKLRGGSWDILETAAFLGLIIWLISNGEGFVPNLMNPGWGLERPNPFQPPAAESEIRYPPLYDLLFPRKTNYADRPGGSQIMSGVNPQSSIQLSTNVVPTQTQMSGFVTNGKVDLNKCLNEVNRRASQIGCTDFECSLERFKALATENGQLTSGTAREAITILQGEMLGYYRNARRENYGVNITGPDFVVEGIGAYENITHVEIKNPVGSAIKIANGQKGSIAKQGKKIGAKIVYQQNFWSNTTKTSEFENLNPTALLPESPDNVLGAVDNFDVPSSEKAPMTQSVLNGSKNNTNIIFLNNN